MTAGAADVKGKVNADINKSNFSSQTETTIQVGWSGGGHIKPSILKSLIFLGRV